MSCLSTATNALWDARVWQAHRCSGLIMLWLGEALQGFMHTAVRLATFEAAHHHGERSWPKSVAVSPTLRIKHLVSATDVVSKQTLHRTLYSNLEALSYDIHQSSIIDSRFAMCIVVQQPLSPDVNSRA